MLNTESLRVCKYWPNHSELVRNGVRPRPFHFSISPSITTDIAVANKLVVIVRLKGSTGVEGTSLNGVGGRIASSLDASIPTMNVELPLFLVCPVIKI